MLWVSDAVYSFKSPSEESDFIYDKDSSMDDRAKNEKTKKRQAVRGGTVPQKKSRNARTL